MKERQELWCHNCQQYVQFDINVELEGNHIIECPDCRHKHCRVVLKGKITDQRWGQRNNNYLTYYASGTAYSPHSTYDTYSGTSAGTSGNYYLYGSWLNTTQS